MSLNKGYPVVYKTSKITNDYSFELKIMAKNEDTFNEVMKKAYDTYGIAYVNCKECKHFKFVNMESCNLGFNLYPRTCNEFEWNGDVE